MEPEPSANELIKEWFTKAEIKEIVGQIVLKIETNSIEIGNIDDQLLLMDILKDIFFDE